MNDVTRSDLYELVWAQPRSVLAKQFKISDVALAKRCLQANIPMPPRGYWAKLQAGLSKPTRPPLPLRLPGSRETVSFGQDRYGSRAITDEELQSPTFSESIERLVEAAVQRLDHVSAIRDLTNPHAGLSKVLRAEAGRRQEYETNKWDFYRPYFDDPAHQRQMRIVNSLLHAFNRLGCSGSMSDRAEWEQGRGTSHDIVGHVGFGGTSVTFGFSQAKDGALVIAIVSKSAPLEWRDEPRRPVERQLDDIARGLLEAAERHHRAEVLRRHHWALEQNAEREREEQARREAAELKLAEEAARQRQRAKAGLLGMARDHRAANDIRALVVALKGKPELSVQGADSAFAKWCAYALAQAEDMDPVAMACPASFETDVMSARDSGPTRP
jgi:hypothetical protein